MNSQFKAHRISDKVWWVGAVDWQLRDFHGYATEKGSTYNAYLIMADKITLIDTVKRPFLDEMLSRISSVTDPKNIKVVVSNHTEMDHSGSIPDIAEIAKPEKIIASEMGAKALTEHFKLKMPVTPVKDWEKLSLGNMELSFIETRMVHWPDSMFTYLESEKTLFSSDAFGMHLASSSTYADEIDKGVLHWEMKKYYANILTPFAHLILRLLDKVVKSDLAINTIATAHGPIFRKDIGWVLEKYQTWSKQESSKRVVIVFDTMWKSTEAMALAIAEGVRDADAIPYVMPLAVNHRSDVVTEALDAGAILVGSPTLNGGMMPTVADILTYLKGLKRQNLIGGAFGSYGWNGVAVEQINQFLRDMKVDLVSEGISVKYVPNEDTLKRCFDLGRAVGEKLCQLVDRRAK